MTKIENSENAKLHLHDAQAEINDAVKSLEKARDYLRWVELPDGYDQIARAIWSLTNAKDAINITNAALPE